MIIKLKSKESSEIIINGHQIELFSILINGKELTKKEYILFENHFIAKSWLPLEISVRPKPLSGGA